MSESLRDVVGIGNAIVDVLARTDEAFLAGHGMTKGSMILIDAERAVELYGQMTGTVECSGGSAANTLAGLASLGGVGAYIGKVRDDPLGEVFRRDIQAQGVAFATPAASTGPPTARCLIFVTPDAQRTMNTFLGASATLTPDDVDAHLIENAKVTYLEGYLWDPAPAKQAFLRAAEIAHASGRKVALSLSDSFCVDRHRAEFQDLVERHVDVLFANEAEIVSLYETADFESAARRVKGRCEIAAITRGEQGSVVLTADSEVGVPAEPVAQVVDTTGAGDLYASGFLYGLTRGLDARACARLGGLAAAEIIRHVGARPRAPLGPLVDRVRDTLPS